MTIFENEQEQLQYIIYITLLQHNTYVYGVLVYICITQH